MPSGHDGARCVRRIKTYAPVDIFPTLGQKLGKAAMTQSLAGLHVQYSRIAYEVLSIIADDDRVAALLDLRLHVRGSDRVIRLQIGNFYTLRQGRILLYRQFLDSFDAVQQKLRRDRSHRSPNAAERSFRVPALRKIATSSRQLTRLRFARDPAE